MALPDDGRCGRPIGGVSDIDENVDVDDVVDPDEDAVEITGNEDVQNMPGFVRPAFED